MENNKNIKKDIMNQSKIDKVSGKSFEQFDGRKNRKYRKQEASPHIKEAWTTDYIMKNVLIALVPAILGSLFFFGPGVIPYYAISILSCFVAEILCFIIRNEKILLDFSSVVTGTLLAMSLPPSVPLWFPAAGGFIAIVVGKHLFGGIGRNFLNPALFGRAFLRLVFPVQMTMNAIPDPPFNMIAPADSVTSATPLSVLSWEQSIGGMELWNSFIGMVPGKIGETSALLLLIGAGYMLWKKIIKPWIPCSILVSIAVMAIIFGGNDGLFSADLYTVLGYILGGATILGAFFMATDYSSSPTTVRGEVLFGVGCGVVIMAFRLWSSMPEGMTFAILIMNLAVPFIDYFIRPRVLGEGKTVEQ